MRAAAVQLNATEHTDRNRATADRLVREAAERGAQLVVLPEKWTRSARRPICCARRPSRSTARPSPGRARSPPSSASTSSPARSSRRPTRAATTTRPCTSAPTASSHAVYRKIHLFDVEVAGRVYRESDLESPGEEIVTTETADGVSVGPDGLLRPALPRALPRARGARRAVS